MKYIIHRNVLLYSMHVANIANIYLYVYMLIRNNYQKIQTAYIYTIYTFYMILLWVSWLI